MIYIVVVDIVGTRQITAIVRVLNLDREVLFNSYLHNAHKS